MQPEQPRDIASYFRRLLRNFSPSRLQPEQPREVTCENDSLRVTLREGILGKLRVVVGGTYELFFVALVEVFFLGILLVLLGNPLPQRFLGPEILKKMGIDDPIAPWMLVILVTFFAFAWAVATWAAIRWIDEYLHLLFGSDTIEVGTSVWHATRKTGPFRQTRTFDPAAGWTVTVLLMTEELAARRGRKIIVVSDCGTRAERVWVRDEIRRRFPPTSGALPEGYSSRVAEGGGVIVTRDGERTLTKKAWHVAPNFFERRLDIFGFKHTSRITDATVRLNFISVFSGRRAQVRGSIKFRLELHAKGGRWISVAKSRRHVGDTLALSEFLARETGWSLEIAPQAWE